ncbi:MAG: DUF47 family protein [Candidatus Micrarchaeota archaeon]
MRRVISFFLPKEAIFFELFEKEIQNSLSASRELLDFMENYHRFNNGERRKRVGRIKEYENAGDDITKQIIDNLHSTFITPIDHEDIHELAVRLDDSVDLMDTLAKKILYYKLKKMPLTLKQQLRISCEQLEEVKKEVIKLKLGKKISEEHKKIDELENRADDIHSKAMEELFEKKRDAIDVIKLKDLYENAEQITDKAQHISIILEGIVIRNV